MLTTVKSELSLSSFPKNQFDNCSPDFTLYARFAGWHTCLPCELLFYLRNAYKTFPRK